MRISIVNTYFLCFLYLVLSLTTKNYGQSSITPIVLPFDKICAGGNFNEFNATFNYSGFPAGTAFEVILSDSSGSFTNPITTTILSTTDISTSQQTIKFAVPTTLIGSDIYKLRVKSSTGFISGSFQVINPSGGTLNFFPAYYKAYEDVYFINNKQSTATICTGGSVTLSIDNPTPGTPNSSPANYPSIKYKWYNGNTVIPGETGSSIIVNSAGTYYAILDYGSCTDSSSRSNEVSVSVSAGGGSFLVSSSLGNTVCSGGAMTTLSSITGNTYQWYKNNVKINGATNATYNTNQGGLYYVKIDFGGCIGNSKTFDLKETNIQSTINIQSPTTIREGDTKTVVVTTTALNPTFEWYKDNILISGNNTNTYDVTSEGNYLVKVTENSTCVIVNEIPFVINIAPIITVIEIPNLVTPNNDGKNDFWTIPEQYVNNKTQVVIIDTNGEQVFTTDNYNNWPDPGYWPNPNNPINFNSVNSVYYYIMTAQNGEVKKGSITILK